MITLTTPVPFGNGTRLVVKATPNEEDAVFFINLTLQSPAGIVYSEQEGWIRDGLSDRWTRQALVAGDRPQRAIRHERSVLTTPTGFTDLFAAWRAPGTLVGRRAALEQHLIAVSPGYVVDFAGT
jgi:hypothetical protein